MWESGLAGGRADNSPPWSSKATKVRMPASLLYAAINTKSHVRYVCILWLWYAVVWYDTAWYGMVGIGCAVVVDMLMGGTVKAFPFVV